MKTKETLRSIECIDTCSIMILIILSQLYTPDLMQLSHFYSRLLMSLVRLFQAVRPQTCGVAHTAVQTVCVRNMAADPKAAKVNKMKSSM